MLSSIDLSQCPSQTDDCQPCVGGHPAHWLYASGNAAGILQYNSGLSIGPGHSVGVHITKKKKLLSDRRDINDGWGGQLSVHLV